MKFNGLRVICFILQNLHLLNDAFNQCLQIWGDKLTAHLCHGEATDCCPNSQYSQKFVMSIKCVSSSPNLKSMIFPILLNAN